MEFTKDEYGFWNKPTGSDFKLSTQDRSEVSAVCDNDEFVTEFEEIVEEFRILNEFQETTESGRTDLKGLLNSLKKDIERIHKAIMEMHEKFYVLLVNAAGRGFFNELDHHLGYLQGVVWKIESRMEKHREFAQRKITAPLYVCDQIRSLLGRYKIKTSIYRGNAWVLLTDIALKAAGRHTEDAAIKLASHCESLNGAENGSDLK